MSYRIREVDASDEEMAETIREFNRIETQWPAITDDELEGDGCHWWLAYDGEKPIGFAGLTPSQRYPNAGYFKRVLVLPRYRGQGLQSRFFRALERRAKAIGWDMIVSETTNTVYSANNFIRAGYKLFDPEFPWAFSNSMYWRKRLD